MKKLDIQKTLQKLIKSSEEVYSVLEFQTAFGETSYKICSSPKEELDFLIHGDHKGHPVCLFREGEVTEHGQLVLEA